MNEDYVMLYPGACAACRHQRKRCDAGCQLAKYFPANKNEDFQNVHKLYGVSNLIRLLNSAPDDQRDKTAETLILEARIRRDYPVRGSLEIEANLRAQIDAYERELDFVKKQLSFYKGTKKTMDHEEMCSMLNTPNQQFGTPLDGYYDQALTTIGLPHGEILMNDTNFDGYNYKSTLEEGEDIKSLVTDLT